MRMASASLTFRSCEGLTRTSFSFTRPAAIACCARLRVLKKRAAQSHLSMRSEDSGRTGDAGAAQPAIAVRVPGEVLLVVILGVIELGRGANFGGNRSEAFGLQRLLVHLLRLRRGLRLGLTICIQRRAVLRAGVVALAHALRRIVRFPEALEQLFVG